MNTLASAADMPVAVKSSTDKTGFSSSSWADTGTNRHNARRNTAANRLLILSTV